MAVEPKKRLMMDAPGGLEPPHTESESAVLPLDDGADGGGAIYARAMPAVNFRLVL